jgi:hypothetical protein
LNQEAGGVSQTFDGEPVFKLSLKPRSVIAASHPDLFAKWAFVLRDVH